MGYPPFEPEESGADRFVLACCVLLFSLFTGVLLMACLFSAGRLLFFIVPALIPPVLVARLVEKRAKSPTARQVAIYFQWNVACFTTLVPLFALAYYFTYLR